MIQVHPADLIQTYDNHDCQPEYHSGCRARAVGSAADGIDSGTDNSD